MKRQEAGAKKTTGSRSSSRAERLSEGLSKRLAAYAAGAAGVGLLVTAQPAAADIIFTPANISFTNGTLFINLNHDAVNDFKISDEPGYFGVNNLQVNGNGNRGAGIIGGASLASALSSGAIIGPHKVFQRVGSASLHMVSTFLNSSSSIAFRGNFLNVTDKFLGLRFLIGGRTHFGWAEFNVSVANFVVTATLTGYAYDSVPNQQIIAGQTKNLPSSPTPEPATLGLLALGSLGLAAWRKRKTDPAILRD